MTQRDRVNAARRAMQAAGQKYGADSREREAAAQQFYTEESKLRAARRLPRVKAPK